MPADDNRYPMRKVLANYETKRLFVRRHYTEIRVLEMSLPFACLNQAGSCAVGRGGRGGIRTLEAVLPPTRFPVARTRPGYATLPWRRGWDSNPRRLITSPLFESGTFNHSDTSPTCEVYQRGRRRRRQNGGVGNNTAQRVPRCESEVRPHQVA